MALDWNKKVHDYFNTELSGYDAWDEEEGWRDEWSEYAQQEKRPMWGSGRDITQSEFENAYRDWLVGSGVDEVEDAADEAQSLIDNVQDEIRGNQYEVRFVGGAPVIYKVARDEDGTILSEEQYKSYADQYGAVDDIMDREFQTLDEFGGERLDEYQAGQDQLLQILEQGPSHEDYETALSHVAQMMGLEDASGYRSQMEQDRTALDEGIRGQQGLTPEERTQMEELMYEEANLMEEAARITNDSVTRSFARKMAHADQARRQISDWKAQQQVSMLQEDFTRQAMNYEVLKDKLWTTVQAGQMGMQDYLNRLQQDRYQALQGYAQGITQITNQYATESQALAQHAQTIYEGIHTQLGIDMAAQQNAQAAYTSHIQPFLDTLNAELTNLSTQQSVFNTQVAGIQADIATDQMVEEEGFLNKVFDTVIGVGGVVAGIATGNPALAISGGTKAFDALFGGSEGGQVDPYYLEQLGGAISEVDFSGIDFGFGDKAPEYTVPNYNSYSGDHTPFSGPYEQFEESYVPPAAYPNILDTPDWSNLPFG